MRHVVRITFERRRLFELHGWLDQFAPGWAYYNQINKTAAHPARQRQLIEHNEVFAQQNIDNNTGHLTSMLSVILPDGKAAMAARIAWLECSLEILDHDAEVSTFG